jgi:hypothetical protein
MKQSFVRLALTATLVACAGRQAPQTSPTAKADLDAAFTCTATAIQSAGYRVFKDDRTLAIRGSIREDGGADPTSLGGPVGGQGSVARPNDGYFDMPYQIDGIDAVVSLDDSGKVKIAAEAYTGAGASSKSGYVKRPASARGASVVKRVEGCAK